MMLFFNVDILKFPFLIFYFLFLTFYFRVNELYLPMNGFIAVKLDRCLNRDAFDSGNSNLQMKEPGGFEIGSGGMS